MELQEIFDQCKCGWKLPPKNITPEGPTLDFIAALTKCSTDECCPSCYKAVKNHYIARTQSTFFIVHGDGSDIENYPHQIMIKTQNGGALTYNMVYVGLKNDAGKDDHFTSFIKCNDNFWNYFDVLATRKCHR